MDQKDYAIMRCANLENVIKNYACYFAQLFVHPRSYLKISLNAKILETLFSGLKPMKVFQLEEIFCNSNLIYLKIKSFFFEH